MRSFQQIYAIAVELKGGADEVESQISLPKSAAELKAIPDDRWLAAMTRSVFQAGFSWKVIEKMWPGFEAAFEGFDIGRCVMLNEEDFERLVSDKRIVRYGAKIKSVQQNAALIGGMIKEHGSAGAAFGSWPESDYIGLLDHLKKNGSRLGGTTGQYFLRQMGVSSFILARDVVGRLVAEGVVTKAPSSKKDMAATQAAFNAWMEQSGRSLTEVSRVLATSL